MSITKKRKVEENTTNTTNLINNENPQEIPPPNCIQSGFCLDFGEDMKIIKEYFDYFVSFHDVKSIVKIGEPSLNGFIRKLTYERNGYKASAILKSSLSHGDNLMYEYLVGCFINRYKKRVPCFVETYGLFAYNDTVNPNKKIVDNRFLQNGLTLLDYAHQHEVTELDDLLQSLKKSCVTPSKMAILIENVDHSISLEKFIHDKDPNLYQVDPDELNITYLLLFQLYYALSQMSNVFTHYDLHGKNILVYDVGNKGEWINMHYRLSDNTEVHFKTPYLIKIIDYGRCFFGERPTSSRTTSRASSRAVFHKLCQMDECRKPAEDQLREKCVLYNYANYPFGYDHENTLETVAQITPLKRNKSYDLIMLNFLKVDFPRNHFFKKVVYNPLPFDDTSEENYFGTREQSMAGYTLDGKIYNVDDALVALTGLIRSSKLRVYDESKKIGDLHIFTNADMEFVAIPVELSPFIFITQIGGKSIYSKFRK